jgi:anthranilate synthase component I
VDRPLFFEAKTSFLYKANSRDICFILVRICSRHPQKGRRFRRCAELVPGMQINPPFATFKQSIENALETLDPSKRLVVPVFLELPSDLETPLSVYLKLRQQPRAGGSESSKPSTSGSGPSFLLESVQHGESVGRYSFVGIQPRWLLQRQSDHYLQWDVLADKPLEEPTRFDVKCDPFAQLQSFLDSVESVETAGLPRNWGGVVGYFGYPCVFDVEPTVIKGRTGDVPQDQIPKASFLYSRCSVLFDHSLQRMYLTLAVICQPQVDLKLLYEQAGNELLQLKSDLARPLISDNSQATENSVEWEYLATQSEFCQSIVTAKEHIAAGDIFQIVLSQRVSAKAECDAVSLYRALRLKNPSPYMLLLDFEDFQLVGASPEMLVQLSSDSDSSNRLATTRPIAGTRPRGANEAEDRILAAELLNDPKERAEHMMLLDLGRNDLGRVCEFGSVNVTELMQVQNYSRVMHLESTVTGQLKPIHSPTDLLRATFPAGTVSGAPKVRAMQLIDQLEPVQRGPYAGTVGTISFHGDLNTCIAIRTLWKQGDRVYLQAGAGIVADSNPQLEFEETLAKLKGVMDAVELAESGKLGRTVPQPSVSGGPSK